MRKIEKNRLIASKHKKLRILSVCIFENEYNVDAQVIPGHETSELGHEHVYNL